MSRTSLVLAVAPKEASPIPLADLVKRLKQLNLPAIGLVWHDYRFRDPEKMTAAPASEEELQDEDDSHFRLIITCSVLEGAKQAEEIITAHILSCFRDEVVAAEVWITAPCLVPTAEVSEQQLVGKRGVDSQSLQVNTTTLKEVGLLVFTSCVQPSDLEPLLSAVDSRIQAAEENLSTKHPDIQIGMHLFAFMEMSSRGEQRFDLLFDEHALPSAIDQLARNGPWVPTVSSVLGDQFKFAVSIVYSRPGAKEQDWHSDGKHIGVVGDFNGKEAAAPYALCVFMTLIDLDYAVGFTQFWPASHQNPGLAGFGPAAEVLGATYNGIMEAGGALIYDYRLMHRGMPNKGDRQRPLLQFLYHDPEYQETKNYGKDFLF